MVDKTQISNPHEQTRHHNSIKLSILLSLRADLLCILQYETPCRTIQWVGAASQNLDGKKLFGLNVMDWNKHYLQENLK